MGFLGRLLTTLVTLAVIAGGVLLWAYANFTEPGPLQTATVLVVPKGLGVEGIAAQLAEGGVLEQPSLFAISVRALGNSHLLRAGEYQFPARASPREVMNILMFAKPVLRRLTIPEGLTVQQIVDEVDHTEGLEGRVASLPPEGTLLPETYDFHYGDSRDEMVARMRRAMSDMLAASWNARPPAFPLTTPDQALTLASIVEKETGRADERPRIAAVFLNRLARHMKLQSDPTVVYGLTQGKGPLGRTLSHADLATPSAYNTYLHDGLPPGPIADPGRAAVLAVLHPAETDDLYFVADGAGGHSFAKTLDEHNTNVTHLRRLEAVPGGKPQQ